MNERAKKCTNEFTIEWINVQMNLRFNDYICKWMSKWITKWMNEFTWSRSESSRTTEATSVPRVEKSSEPKFVLRFPRRLQKQQKHRNT
jgi:hypothetical protein